MSDLPGQRSAGTASSKAEERAERRLLSFYDLLFLGAGGVVGSGWLLGAVEADAGAGSWAVFSWLIGGALLVVIAAVMVQVSTTAPKTGGLVFLPLQSSGPLVATVVAAGVWVFYAVNPASEAAAMTRGLATWQHSGGLVKSDGDGLAARGIALSLLFVMLLAAVNLLGPRLFLVINNALTAFKIVVPLLIVALLVYAELHPPGHPPHFGPAHPSPGVHHPHHYDLGSVISTVTSSGVIYAYLGYQGPLDFAGGVRRRGIGEAARLRRAVYGTVVGSVFLYVALQFVVIYIRHRSGGAVDAGSSPYTQFVSAVAPHWAAAPLVWLIHVDTILSPAGAGMVYTYVLTREIAAFSRAHLTHRGLQKTSFSTITLGHGRLRRLFGEDRLDVYWLILIVDFVISGVALLCFGGKWSVLGDIDTVLALVVYATPSVVLASLQRRDPRLFPRRRSRVLATTAFVSSAVIFYLAGWDVLWPGMAALTAGCLLLFALPLAAPASRWYDAKAHAVQLRHLRTSPAARSAALLYGYFAFATVASSANRFLWPAHPLVKLVSAVPLAVLAVVVFRQMVTLSVRYMDDHAPTLPTPAPPDGAVASPPPHQPAVTVRSG
ncbi:APC family permease [Actinacidiphila paucisporea]|uniref:Amino acid transporter n=1 Tax=Actinacidiphila paucisporea TaxID=310782 RepID=A0A1M7M161_9ACTN|nr:APC family permease [Actinacidiphila paucisporea]SHM84279.1 Amino acid transporter [Actinacidiphila paucisporea]